MCACFYYFHVCSVCGNVEKLERMENGNPLEVYNCICIGCGRKREREMRWKKLHDAMGASSGTISMKQCWHIRNAYLDAVGIGFDCCEYASTFLVTHIDSWWSEKLSQLWALVRDELWDRNSTWSQYWQPADGISVSSFHAKHVFY